MKSLLIMAAAFVSILHVSGSRTFAQTLVIDSLKSGIDSDSYVDNSETLFVSGFGFAPPVLVVKLRPYLNRAAGTDINNPTNNITINVGGKNDSCYGYIVVDNLPRGGAVDSVKISVLDNDFNSGWTDYIQVDDVPPGFPSVFSASAQGDNLEIVRLLWKGSGDNGASGWAEACTVKFARFAIESELHWDSSLTKDLPCAEPDPTYGDSLFPQEMLCDMWDEGDSNFYYAIKFEDNMGNTSTLKWYASPVNTKPVELSSFSAVMQYGTVNLAWRTESETDNASWRLERNTVAEGGIPEVVYIKRKDAITQTTSFPTSYVFEDSGVEAGKTYYYTLYDISLDGIETAHGPVSTDGISIYEGDIVKDALVLAAIEPNPVRYRAGMSFGITPHAFSNGVAGAVTLDVTRLDGRQSYRILDSVLGAGQYHNIIWDRGNAEPGIYAVKLSTGTHTVTRRLMVIGR